MSFGESASSFISSLLRIITALFLVILIGSVVFIGVSFFPLIKSHFYNMIMPRVAPVKCFSDDITNTIAQEYKHQAVKALATSVENDHNESNLSESTIASIKSSASVTITNRYIHHVNNNNGSVECAGTAELTVNPPNGNKMLTASQAIRYIVHKTKNGDVFSYSQSVGSQLVSSLK